MSGLPKPPYDPELSAFLAQVPYTSDLSNDYIAAAQAMCTPTVAEALTEFPNLIDHREYTIKGPGSDIIISVFRKKDSTSKPGGRPAIYHIHGGGMILGNRFYGLTPFLHMLVDVDAVMLSVEYRLSPRHPDPSPVEDCYAGLVWTAKNANELGIDPSNLMVAGVSAGGGLAAGVSLLARDRNGPAIKAQLLVCPMIDDRNTSLSSKQYVGEGIWSREHNAFGWKCLLGSRVGGKYVSIYAAPARATDLSRLPPAFIDVASAEVFRDEDVAYATALWAHGVQCELHVWPGGFHAFDLLAPTAVLSVIALETRAAWVRRTLQSTANPAPGYVSSMI